MYKAEFKVVFFWLMSITSKMFCIKDFSARRNLYIIVRMKHTWLKPKGHDTGIKVYNCVTKNKQPLIVRNKNLVTWYSCGPTVYDSAHIGHASSYVKLDIIQRILTQYFNLNLVTVMNITDVDDKLIARSRELKVPVVDLAKKYEKEFLTDLNSLQVQRPNCILRVTENIEIIKDFIKKLVDEGKAYQGKDNSIYFDTNKYEDYGKLENISEEQENSEYKKSSRDFALWKANKPNEIFWKSAWGPGRPGWHIECSALASHLFGSNIDIHAGGIDLRFPHHENEETQSCSFHNTSQWVNYWIHTGHLHLKSSEKMSKSLKNTISISEMLKTTNCDVFRMACLMNHYKSGMEFTPEFMATAENNLKNYKNFLDNCNNYINGYFNCSLNNEILNELILNSSEKIHSAILDDFNTPAVLSVLNEVISVINNMLQISRNNDSNANSKSAPLLASVNLVESLLNMFGLRLNNNIVTANDENFAEVMNILNNFRQEIRGLGIANKDKTLLNLCDLARDDLKAIGITIKDHSKASSWSS